MKQQTIKYLQWQIDEINNNILGMKMSDEDLEYNKKTIDEITKCIKWLKELKV